MKKIGLIGGVSYQSTIEYYHLINKEVNRLQGTLNTAHIFMESFNFSDIAEPMFNDRWDIVENIMIDAACRLEAAGADFLAISCNSLHKVVPAVERSVNIPLLHILTPAGLEIIKRKIVKVGLLGARFIMDECFYSDYLRHHFNIEAITPSEEDKLIVEKVILQELCFREITEESRIAFNNIIYSLQKRGAQGIILGCTELALLMPLSSEKDIPIFDTTFLHSREIAHFALEKNDTIIAQNPFETFATPDAFITPL